jgi:hypothetical protein
LIVRRVKDKNVVAGQGELFTAWRYHAFITDSTLELVAAEKQHREHAIIEQVNADLKDSTLAHMPSGSFAANAALLALAANPAPVTPLDWRADGSITKYGPDPDPVFTLIVGTSAPVCREVLVAAALEC